MALDDELRSDHPMTNEMHKLGSHLWRLVQNESRKVVLVTSALRGEGKSTTVAYLSAALAMHPGRKILALDTDFRNPSLNRHFGVMVHHGLAEVLRGECTISDAILHTGLANDGSGLDLLVPDPQDADPDVLLNTPKLAELFRFLRHGYDMVLVDVPALIPVPDGATVMPHCDGVILAVMAGLSTRHHVRRARELCIGLGAEILGVVVGNVQQAAPEYMDVNYYGYAAVRSKKRAPRPRVNP